MVFLSFGDVLGEALAETQAQAASSEDSERAPELIFLGRFLGVFVRVLGFRGLGVSGFGFRGLGF